VTALEDQDSASCFTITVVGRGKMCLRLSEHCSRSGGILVAFVFVIVATLRWLKLASVVIGGARGYGLATEIS
jgi:hypothetical protein